MVKPLLVTETVAITLLVATVLSGCLMTHLCLCPVGVEDMVMAGLEVQTLVLPVVVTMDQLAIRLDLEAAVAVSILE